MPSPFWTPRHGQLVLCDVAMPPYHVTPKGQTVGIFQAAEKILDPSTRLPQLDEAGNEMWNPPFIAPMDANGGNVCVDRTNYKDFKGRQIIVPGKGLCKIGEGESGAAVDKFFADNRMAERNLVLGIPEAKLVGPLLDKADMPPGREVHPEWVPKP